MVASVAIFAGDIDSRVSKLESTSAQTTTHSYADNSIARLSTAYPIVKDPYHLKLEIGAVYQTIQVGSTEFATEFNAGYLVPEPDTDDLSYPYSADILKPKSKMGWGINLAASYAPFLEEYDLRLANKYFENSSNSKTTTNSLSSFITGLNVNGYVIYDTWFDFTSSRLKAGYNLLGLELGRATSWSKKFSVRPFVGLMSSWIWLDQHSTYSFSDDANSAYEHTKTNWFGIGPQAGLNGNFALNKNFSIFLDTKGALMYGSFKDKHTSSSTEFLPTFFNYEIAKISDKKVVPYAEVILGGSYECFDKQGKNHFKLRAGYDVQFFISGNQSLIYELEDINENAFTRAKDDISTQGLILDLAWSF